MRFGLILIALIAAGCAEAPEPIVYVAPDMLARVSPPKPPQAESRFGEQTLVVAPVTGVGASSGDAVAASGPSIAGGTFREALIESIEEAGLFARVSEHGSSRYVLSAEVLQQTPTGYGATIAVRYALKDTQVGGEVLNEYLAATYSFPPRSGIAFVAGQTPTVAIERASAKNFALLITRLANLNDYSTE